MKLAVKECGEPAHGTAEYALVLEGWPANVSKEDAQRAADAINVILQEAPVLARKVLGLQP